MTLESNKPNTDSPSFSAEILSGSHSGPVRLGWHLRWPCRGISPRAAGRGRAKMPAAPSVGDDQVGRVVVGSSWSSLGRRITS